jgi:energy-coupling factor transport system permease protein
VLSIALTFIPQTTRSLARIREAQAVRGHRVRGLRDWLPIFVPLLVSGLERSMGLAEAMVARGYGAVSDREQPLRTQVLLAAGLFSLLGGWLGFLFLPSWKGVGLGLMAVGAGVVATVLWLAGRGVSHTTYRIRRWTARDTLAVLGCGLALAAVLVRLPLVDRSTLYYSPYPALTRSGLTLSGLTLSGMALPAFDPLIGLGLLGLLAPALVCTGGQADRENRAGQGSDREGERG